ncbi:MAG: hypothetical protein A3B86_00620 [Candidatus Yanofskybacteria bacterium RIFCSPHIGHO2_02_FULL_38_22b]|uniref:Lycopene cyclase domain-containing protein n=1 Tax=Candidatus Yanofskybacteria bacterium RIFCSPHIGHO2_02_FULL_38_22b TaxID=1802673 RepID=A0A1F8F377_9BACT|nr:MAG: hypothetical protein A2816_03645 [Candidatus Yanofskybacteria bacterium RIFCSPHIGHO2_01_FULL_39_44]OGN07583.1 MAG: hypothetical protein A3B86_00620 [Candidatus Yanofskybacteria bacterium RIFCSPHIGHO2_02_FULL_38_22b]OGN20212.1 MAG: hypothetical protein A2910_00155 [Candidatus Yanofskybacteria bacterium RIFCSPLOWO2_01_FULL_39_28]
MNKIYKIFLNSIPILVMVGLIPLISNDFLLTAAFGLVVVVSFLKKREPKESLIFVAGFLLMVFFEYIFILTGVEVFYRNSLFGVMPIWLPLLWAYGFVAMSRIVKILDKSTKL